MPTNCEGCLRYVGVIVTSLSLVSSYAARAAAFSDDADSASIRRVVEETQRAGHQRHDLDKYMSLWATDAKIIGGRSEERGDYDTTLTRNQIEATRRLRFRAAPVKSMKLTFENTEVRVKENLATLGHQVTVSMSGYVEAVREVYCLRKTAGVWKAYENRWWPIKMGDADQPVEYTPEAWRALDQQVVEAKQLGNPEVHVQALMAAFRFGEALQAAEIWTGRSPKRADAWVARGTAAVLSGDADDARMSFKRALALDPQCNVPQYARDIGKTKSERREPKR